MSQTVTPFRKGFSQSPAQLKRTKAFDQIKMLLRRASVYDPLRQTPTVAGGDKSFPGFAFKVNVYFQTEAEALEFQRLTHSIRRRTPTPPSQGKVQG